MIGQSFRIPTMVQGQFESRRFWTSLVRIEPVCVYMLRGAGVAQLHRPRNAQLTETPVGSEEMT